MSCEGVRFRNLPYLAKEQIKLTYKGDHLKQMYQADFVCFGKIVVELKAVTQIIPDHEAQLLNYLKATGFRVGMLANFGSYPNVEVERRIL